MLDDIDDGDDDDDDDDDDDQPIWAVQGECRVGVQLAADLLDAGDRQLIKCSSFTKLFKTHNQQKQTLITDNRSNQMKLIKTNKKKQLLPLNVP